MSTYWYRLGRNLAWENHTVVQSVSQRGNVILHLGTGTFSRASTAIHMVDNQTLVTAPTNAMRFEDRGDGGGAAWLLEGSRQNLFDFRKPSDFSNQHATVNVSAGTSLIDGRVQDTVTYGSSAPNHQVYDDTGRNFTAVAHAHSAWYKFLSGTNTNFVIYPQLVDTVGGIDITNSPTVWTYGSDVSTYTAQRIGNIWRDNAAETKTAIIAGHQVEVGTFPSSVIDVSGAPATRAADSLTFASGEYPASLTTGAWSFDFFPYFSQGELAAGDSDVLVSFGGTNDEIRYVGDANAFEVVTSGTRRGISSAVTFSRHQKLTLTVDWHARELTVAGATSGNSTVSLSSTDEWPSNVTLRVGGEQGGTAEAFGRYSDFRAA